MKLYIDSFKINQITSDDSETVVKGSIDFNKLGVYLDTTTKNSYTTIYPIYTAKRADGRVIGPLSTLTTADTSVEGYYGWVGSIDSRMLEVEGPLEITIAFICNSTITKTIGKVTFQIRDAIVSNDDILVIGDVSEAVTSMQESIRAIAEGLSIVQNTNVTTEKINDSAVTTAKLASSSVTTSKIADGNVSNAKLSDNSVTTPKIADGAITIDKIGASTINYIDRNLGYVELEWSDDFEWELDSSQILETKKKYCIIVIVDDSIRWVYYKTIQNDSFAQADHYVKFKTISDGVSVLNDGRVLIGNSSVITVNTNTGHCSLDDNAIANSYTKNKIDELLQAKVDKTAVYNALDQTQNGYVLDARQGKVLKDALDTLYNYVGYATQDDTGTTIDRLREIFQFLAGASDDETLLAMLNAKQDEITAQNKLSSDLVDDTNGTNKFVTAAEKAQITQNADDIEGMLDGTKSFEKVSTENIDITSDSGAIKFTSGTSEIYEYNNQDEDDVLVVKGANISRLTTKANNSGNVEVNGEDVYIEAEDVYIDGENVSIDGYETDINSSESTIVRSGNNNKIIIESAEDAISVFTGTFNYNGNEVATKSYVDTKCSELEDKLLWQLGTYDLSVDNDSNVAYQKTIPSGTIDCMINKIGGMSYNINQLVQNGNFVDTTGWNGSSTTLSVNNNIATITATVNSQYCGLTKQNVSLKQGHKYFISYTFNPSGNFKTCIYNGDGVQGQTNTTANTNNKINIIFTQNNDFSYILIYLNYSGALIGDYANISDVQLFDLTAMGIDTTDVSVATSELLKRGIDINEYQAYNTGSIRDSAVSSVVSKDSNDTTLDTLTLDNNIQALNGYGWGINDTCYNYIDFENKKFIQKVGRVKANSLEWYRLTATGYFWTTLSAVKTYSSGTPNLLNNNYSTVAGMYGNSSGMNDKSITIWLTLNRLLINDTSYSDTTSFTNHFTDDDYFYFELETPVETDISQYITTNKVIVEENGTLTFTNTYNQAVPSDVDYLIEEVKA